MQSEEQKNKEIKIKFGHLYCRIGWVNFLQFSV